MEHFVPLDLAPVPGSSLNSSFRPLVREPAGGRVWRACGVLAVSVLLAACAGPQRPAQKAPVVDRMAAPGGTDAQALPPGAENAGKPGYYTVRPGDTLIRIALDTGQNWRDLQAWNGLLNPNLIEVGQVVRVVPPVNGTAVTTSPVTAPAAVAGGKAPVAAGTTTAGIASANVKGQSLGAATTSAPAPVPASTDAAPNDDIRFVWPAAGSVVANFDEARNKGVGIAGKLGDPVLAAADGKVVYAGAGLRGYGNLIIIKHNNTYLTAYAHNQTLLVKEDQAVRQGQKIAEMGNSDADRVKLHFEVRRQGKPVDPLKYLPAR
ncbi:MAG TPA: peptidoglycan DD-metalloendopeptidase family protein [Macromonas sp.]|nr:peptidoglycan DD-metalloendopeptidase family protein [Macromonas sp.]